MATLVKFVRFLMDHIDDAAEICFAADRQRKGNYRACKRLLCRVKCMAEIRMLLFELVYHHKARQHKFVCVLPRLFRLDLDAMNSVHNDQGTISNAQSRPCVRNKGCVARSVY